MVPQAWSVGLPLFDLISPLLLPGVLDSRWPRTSAVTNKASLIKSDSGHGQYSRFRSRRVRTALCNQVFSTQKLIASAALAPHVGSMRAFQPIGAFLDFSDLLTDDCKTVLGLVAPTLR